MIYDVIVVGAGASGLFFSSAFGAGRRAADSANCGVSHQTADPAGAGVISQHADPAGLGVTNQPADPAGAGTASNRKFRGLILEKGKRPGRKLLMSGSGQCNITHAGSIKDFIGCYGGSADGEAGSCAGTGCRDNTGISNASSNSDAKRRKTDGSAVSRQIRSCLYRYNNLSLIDFLEAGDVKTVTREDGKVFPASLDARDVLELLQRRTAENGFEIRYESPVERVEQIATTRETLRNAALPARWQITAAGETFLTNNLVIATGGCSYPTTGSDGSMFRILARDLDVRVTTLKPALSSLQVTDYPYGPLSGISFDAANVTIWRSGERDSDARTNNGEAGGSKIDAAACKKGETHGSGIDTGSCKKITERTDALLFTHHDLSGPVILNLSKFTEPGDIITISYVHPLRYEQTLEKLKTAAQGAKGSLAGIIASEFRLPLRFCRMLTERYGDSLKALAKQLTGEAFRVSSVTGFDKAMATSGGIALSEMDMRTMAFKAHPGLYAIGEALDVDGITGGYNLQFAYSSARIAADSVLAALAETIG